MDFCHFFPVLNMFKHYICTQMSFRYSLRPMLLKSPYQLQEIAQQSAKHHTLDPERSSARCLPSMQNCEVEVTGLQLAQNMPHLIEAVRLEEGVQASTFLGASWVCLKMLG